MGYESHLLKAFLNLYNKNIFSDVTLVCDDQIQLNAHKLVLSTCSPVFENILLTNPHDHPLIYMRGLKHQDLVCILQYMYLGKVNILTEMKNEFINLANQLEVKGFKIECTYDEQVKLDTNKK